MLCLYDFAIHALYSSATFASSIFASPERAQILSRMFLNRFVFEFPDIIVLNVPVLMLAKFRLLSLKMQGWIVRFITIVSVFIDIW